MHAIFVLPRFYPYRGGYENSMLAIARCLVARGHRVTAFSTDADDLESLWLPGHKVFPAEDFIIEGVSGRRFPVCHNRWRRQATRFAGILPYWRWKAQFWTPAFRVPGLQKALVDAEADIIHIGPLPYTNLMYAGLRAAELRGIPVIATPCLHLGESTSTAVSRHYMKSYQIEVLRRCDKVLCMTRIEEEQLRSVGVSAAKLATIGVGIDFQQSTGGDPQVIRNRFKIDGPIVLHLGVKAHEKGSIALVEAMKLLWTRGTQAWLVMAGPSMTAFDEYLAAQSPLPKLVNLPAFADDEKRDLLAAATLVAQPSRVESLGLVVLEAWANAKPVVAADIEVSRKLVTDSGGGVVTLFGDAVTLARELEIMISNPQLCQEMGLCGQRFARNFDGSLLWRRNAEEFERLAAAQVGR